MIVRIVIKKINRAYFHPQSITSVMVSFFNQDGEEQGSQLLSAALFSTDIQEGQSMDFLKERPTPFYIEMDKKD